MAQDNPVGDVYGQRKAWADNERWKRESKEREREYQRVQAEKRWARQNGWEWTPYGINKPTSPTSSYTPAPSYTPSTRRPPSRSVPAQQRRGMPDWVRDTAVPLALLFLALLLLIIFGPSLAHLDA